MTKKQVIEHIDKSIIALTNSVFEHKRKKPLDYTLQVINALANAKIALCTKYEESEDNQ